MVAFMHPSGFHRRTKVVAEYFGLARHPPQQLLEQVQKRSPQQLLAVLHVILVDPGVKPDDTVESIAETCLDTIPLCWKCELCDLEWVQLLCLSWLFPVRLGWGRCNRNIIAVAGCIFGCCNCPCIPYKESRTTGLCKAIPSLQTLAQ